MIYFDNAATTFPKPPAVIKEMAKCMREWGGNPGRSGHPLSMAAAEAVFSVRQALADFFDLQKAEHIIFTQNCTHAVNLALSGITEPGDHVLISNLEHNSVLRTIDALCHSRGLTYEMFDALRSDEDVLYEIQSKIKPKTKAVITTHASNICPRRLPIAEIGTLCRQKGILFVVDAAQSAGIYEISMKNDHISVLCAPGHKGLYGPQGSGFAAFSDDFDFERFSCFIYGGNGRNSTQREMGHEAPDSFEAGTLSTPAIVGLGAGLQFIQSVGRHRIEENEHMLYRHAVRMLEQIPRVFRYLPESQTGSLILLGFEGDSPSAMAQKLGDLGICTRAGLHCAPTAHAALGTGGDALRISFSAMNTLDEINRFVRILEMLLQS